MARTARVKENAAGTAHYHLMSRVNDVSEFMKTFKEVFNIRFKRERSYTGSIWSGRFKSTLIEGGRYLEICRRYVYLNPVRAGIVKHASDYAWSWIAAPDEPFAGSVPKSSELQGWMWQGCPRPCCKAGAATSNAANPPPSA